MSLDRLRIHQTHPHLKIFPSIFDHLQNPWTLRLLTYYLLGRRVFWIGDLSFRWPRNLKMNSLLSELISSKSWIYLFVDLQPICVLENTEICFRNIFILAFRKRNLWPTGTHLLAAGFPESTQLHITWAEPAVNLYIKSRYSKHPPSRWKSGLGAPVAMSGHEFDHEWCQFQCQLSASWWFLHSNGRVRTRISRFQFNFDDIILNKLKSWLEVYRRGVLKNSNVFSVGFITVGIFCFNI